MLRKGNREFTLQSRWDRSLMSVRPRSLSVRPICLGFVAVAMTSKLGGAGWKELVGPSLTFGLGHMWI